MVSKWGRQKTLPRDRRSKTCNKSYSRPGAKYYSRSTPALIRAATGSRRTANRASLILRQLLHGQEQVVRLRQDRVFEDGLIGDESVGGGYPAHGSVQLIKKLIGNARGNLSAVTPAERIFVGHQHAVRFPHRLGNRLPIERIQGTQIDQFDVDAVLALEFLCRLQCPRDHGTVSQHGQVGAGLNDSRLAERDHEIRPRVYGAAIGLAVEALVLEKEHGIVAADGGAEQARSIQCVRRKHDTQSGDMRENAFSALRVIDGPAGEISADGDANHRRA